LTPDYQRLTDASWVGASQCAPIDPDNDLWTQDIFHKTHFMALRQVGYEVLNSPELLRLVDLTPQTVADLR
jgi:hypothetical protein